MEIFLLLVAFVVVAGVISYITDDGNVTEDGKGNEMKKVFHTSSRSVVCPNCRGTGLAILGLHKPTPFSSWQPKTTQKCFRCKGRKVISAAELR